MWESKGLSDENIKPPATLDNSLDPRLDYFKRSKYQLKFDGRCLKSDEVSFCPRKIIHFYITYEIKSWPFYVDNGFTL